MNIVPKVGDFIIPDGWRLGSALVEGEPFRLPTHVEAGPAYLPTKSGCVELTARVEVTGRKIRWVRPGLVGVRVRITFVGDGEPDTSTGGWMAV